MGISFEKHNKKIVLCYIPAIGIDNIINHLDADEVISIKRTFFVTKDLLFEPEMLVAYRNISIFRKIDEKIERDFYIGGEWESHNGISKETFENLLSKFPKTAELDKYAHKRIASIIKDFFPECDKYESIYEKFIKSREKRYTLSTPKLSEYNLKIELEQFTIAYQELMGMLDQ